MVEVLILQYDNNWEKHNVKGVEDFQEKMF